jgi:Golgi phosphoprotein 3 (GPP34)
MLLAEDLLLLLTDDDTGKLQVSGYEIDIALAGAQLIDLSLAGRVELEDKRVVLRDPSPTGDDVLDGALAVAQRRTGKKPGSLIGELGKSLREQLYARLTASGVVRAHQDKVLGIFPTKSWPTVSADHEAGVRRSLTDALVRGLTPDPRTGALIALLNALRATHKVVDPKQHDLKRRDLDRRAKEIAEGNWASDAVRQAVDAMTAAVTVSIAAATVTTTAAAT